MVTVEDSGKGRTAREVAEQGVGDDGGGKMRLGLGTQISPE